MAVPAMTYVFGGLGALFLLRGVWNPHRVVVRKGDVTSCAGPDPLGVCHATMEIGTPKGTSIHAAGAGEVVSVGPDWIHVALKNEPVILHYQGFAPKHKEGSHVWRGQKLGESDGAVRFGVWELVRLETGEVELKPVEPASWLAARGYRVAGRSTGKPDLWCEAGRQIVVPKKAYATCKLRNPSAAGFSLLPVSIEQE